MKFFIRNIGRVLGALRAEKRQLVNRYLTKIPRLEGNAVEICRQIVEKLWEGDFYRTSLGHFDFFWMRDFGTVAESLVKTGYKKHTLHTLRWALLHYRRAGIVTTCIDKAGNCFNAPGAAIDSLPWLLHSLLVSNYDLNKAEREFLVGQLDRYRKKYLDTAGYVRPIKFAEMRDAVIYDRSAYAVTLIGRLAYCVEMLQLDGFPYKLLQYQEELLTRYWNGQYFNADRKTNAFSAECALFPFHLGVIEDAGMAGATFDYINQEKLNEPFALIYTKQPEAFTYHWWMNGPVMPNYQGKTLWSWHGVFYLHLLKRYSRSEYNDQLDKFAKGMIEKHGTFPEMLNTDGSWYYSSIYKGDPGMVWAALYVELVQPSIVKSFKEAH
jgi:hypothetical protein